MTKNEKRRVFEALQEKLNWCPHCGDKAEVFQCDGCDSVCIACSCSSMCAGNINNVIYNSDAIAFKWNNRGLSTKWERKVLEQLGLLNKEWLVVYETGEIVAFASLEGCYQTASTFQKYEEYKNRTFAIFTLENDTPRFMSADEVFDKLNIDKLDWEDQEAC